MAKAYAICKLPEEGDDIITICSNWLIEDGNMTMYPPKSQSSSLKKLLMNKVDASSSWNKYPVTVMGYYETFEKAQEKLRKACETSNLESSDDEDSKKSRNKRKKKSLSKEFRFLDHCSSDEGDSPSKVICGAEKPFPPSPPYPQLSSFIKPTKSQKKNNAPSTSIFADSNNLTVDTTNSQSSPVSSPSHSLLHFADQIHATPRSSQRSERSSPLPSPYNLAARSLQSPMTVGDRTILSQLQTTMTDILNEQKKIKSQLQNTMTDIFSQQKRIIDDLQVLKSGQQLAAVERPEPAAGLSTMFATLPLSTETAFQELQDQLDDKISKLFVRLLTSLGGKDLQQCINNMLRRVMVDQLATTYSFSGKSMAGLTKPAFCKTKICKLILVAAQKVHGTQEATETKIGNYVARWFQQAKTRIDRRGKKRPLEQDLCLGDENIN